MKQSDLIERLRALIPDGDGYNDEFAHTLEAVIAELQRNDTPIPDDVSYQIQVLSDPSSILSIKQQQHIAGMLERLQRRIEAMSVDRDTNEYQIREQQQRIEELEGQVSYEFEEKLSAEIRIEELGDQLAYHQEEAITLENRIEELVTANDKERARVRKKVQRIEELEAKLEQSQNYAMSEGSKLRTQIEKLEAELKAMQYFTKGAN